MDEEWQQVSRDITSLSLALESFEESDAEPQEMLTEIMMRCAQRLAVQLEDLHHAKAGSTSR